MVEAQPSTGLDAAECEMQLITASTTTMEMTNNRAAAEATELRNGTTLVNEVVTTTPIKQQQNGTITSTNNSKSWIKLNVGGKLFMTTQQTLCREAGSFLARLSQDDHSLPSEKDESGSFLIDRDSDYFSSVINYLRHGKLVLDHGLSEEGLREEAEFYNLPKLIALCNERIAEREKHKKAGTKHVYRVLQCHEDELTNVISAMSDGWKFEQLVPIGASQASESGHPEYLCVVSREYPVTANATQNCEISSDRAQFLQKKAMNG